MRIASTLHFLFSHCHCFPYPATDRVCAQEIAASTRTAQQQTAARCSSERQVTRPPPAAQRSRVSRACNLPGAKLPRCPHSHALTASGDGGIDSWGVRDDGGGGGAAEFREGEGGGVS